jgi:hypothetical protein
MEVKGDFVSENQHGSWLILLHLACLLEQFFTGGAVMCRRRRPSLSKLQQSASSFLQWDLQRLVA